jgi:hypothetical protein
MNPTMMKKTNSWRMKQRMVPLAPLLAHPALVVLVRRPQPSRAQSVHRQRQSPRRRGARPVSMPPPRHRHRCQHQLPQKRRTIQRKMSKMLQRQLSLHRRPPQRRRPRLPLLPLPKRRLSQRGPQPHNVPHVNQHQSKQSRTFHPQSPPYPIAITYLSMQTKDSDGGLASSH